MGRRSRSAKHRPLTGIRTTILRNQYAKYSEQRKTRMARRYFGTDGIRGKVGEAPITPDFVLRLGYAAGKVLAEGDRWSKAGSRPTVLIGKDTRVSGYMLEAALESGFSAAG